MCPSLLHRPACRALLLVFAASLWGAEAEVTVLPDIFVTATKLPLKASEAPGMVSALTGQDLADRGVRDLRGALALVGGVDVGPGGDAGPAGSAPGFWGLREVDAFLLVVDGVPYGGAFNPALASLDLTNVDRIEVLRGAAPVMYGATSFVGVIQVIHAAAGATPATFTASAGSPDTASAAWYANLPAAGPLRQALTINAEHRTFTPDDTSLERYHALYRGAAQLDSGRLTVDLELTRLQQSPASPHPREGATLSDRFPLDANVNPLDARADLDRAQLNAGFERAAGPGQWSTTFSYAHTTAHNTRGFLREGFATDGVTVNADGFRQQVTTDDVYVNSFVSWVLSPELQLATGADLLYGDGQQSSDNFEYAVSPDGHNRPDSHRLPTDESTRLGDTRRFLGLYTEAQWTPDPRWRVVAGLRLNDTSEDRTGTVVTTGVPGEETGSDALTKQRLAGSVGGTYRLWTEGRDSATLFTDYRNTYKPAAIDFGPEAKSDILQPEYGQSWQAGIRGAALEHRLDWEASYFDLRMDHMVIRENIGGLPGLANAGSERFKGVEVEGGYMLAPDLQLRAAYAWHDARFADYARLRPDGSIQQLGGKRLELSPELLTAVGLTYAPDTGILGTITWNHIGERYLNKGNTAVAPAYDMLDAGFGYRTKKWTVRLDATNLLDERDPAAESEIGDAQFYLLNGRTVLLTVGFSL
jgi:iron complex outermembrane recepter protein